LIILKSLKKNIYDENGGFCKLYQYRLIDEEGLYDESGFYNEFQVCDSFMLNVLSETKKNNESYSNEECVCCSSCAIVMIIAIFLANNSLLPSGANLFLFLFGIPLLIQITYLIVKSIYNHKKQNKRNP